MEQLLEELVDLEVVLEGLVDGLLLEADERLVVEGFEAQLLRGLDEGEQLLDREVVLLEVVD